MPPKGFFEACRFGAIDQHQVVPHQIIGLGEVRCLLRAIGDLPAVEDDRLGAALREPPHQRGTPWQPTMLPARAAAGVDLAESVGGVYQAKRHFRI